MSAFTSITNGSMRSRPFSASTRQHRKSKLPVEKKGRGLGYFGDERDKLVEYEDKRKMENNFKVKLDDQKTNDQGVATYKNIPVGKYVIEVSGNHMY